MTFNEFTSEDYDLFPNVELATGPGGDIEPLISEEIATDGGPAFIVVDGAGVRVIIADEMAYPVEWRLEGPTAALALAHLTVASAHGTLTMELLVTLGFKS